MVVAAAMLAAPAMATMALAAIGATGGGGQAGIGTLTGSQGLRGDASPVGSAPAVPLKQERSDGKRAPAPPKAHAARHRTPASKPPAKDPTTPEAPPSSHTPAPPRSHTVTPPVYPTDPSQPGSPTTDPISSTGSGSSDSTSTGSGTGTTSGSDASSSYPGSYPGGG